MGSRETLDLINDLERRYPVDEWTVDGVPVWPVMRMRLATAWLFHGYGTGLRGAGSRSIAQRAAGAVADLARLFRNQLIDRSANARLKPFDAVMLSDGVSLSCLDGEWYDRLMDPIVATLSEQGRTSLLLMPGARDAVPRHTPSLYVQPYIDACNARTTALLRVGTGRPHRLDGIGSMLAGLRRGHPDVEFPDDGWLFAQASRILRLSDLFGQWFERTGARVAFVNTYYSAMGMAFVLAGRRAGCTTIDVQHGLQYEHMAYSRWIKAPPGGYSLLPELFWCWGEDEVALKNEGPDALAGHCAVNSGNPWATFWSDTANPAVATALGRLRERKAQFPSGRHLLLTPGRGQHPREMEKLVETARLGGNRTTWWLRLHPAQLEDRESFRKAFADAGVANLEVEQACDAPLPLLLSEIDVNITPDSSTVIDAAHAGTPSVVTTANGATLFHRQIAAGHCRYAQDPPAILAAAFKLADNNPLDGVAGQGTSARCRLSKAAEALFQHRTP